MDNRIPFHASRARRSSRESIWAAQDKLADIRSRAYLRDMHRAVLETRRLPDPHVAPAAFALGPDGLQRGAAYSPRAAEGLEPFSYDPERGVFELRDVEIHRDEPSASPRSNVMVLAAMWLLSWAVLLFAFVTGGMALSALRALGWPL